ncbi:exodeoxyribonuclease V subunit alpha [Nocardioides sp. cx-169]|uniref:exodeoxyribonuclease V subunit alpha n=1 Tax=Nocardioides sp. cx-169 TaxID=2899080 RepID=UPI001E462693|nr:exodeoxyribonuclease V subunit alpha [Nocardioides sp. cx-169]MCD4532837.1 exodeoxyribonuclease V subunit alpha [Nocardioides sp. cx-169]
MTELFEPAPYDRRLALAAAGLVASFNVAGVLEAGDVHVALRVGDLGGESDERVLLAVALAVRAVRSGSVCVDLTTVAALAPELPWPTAQDWTAAVAASPLVAAGAIRIEDALVYLDRYHRLETQVGEDLLARVAASAPLVAQEALASALARVRGEHLSAAQEAASVAAVRQWTTVLTGGPGTGKTTTVARMLVLLADQAAALGERFSVALAAPTGKAATRLQEAVLGELALLDPKDRERVGRPEAMTLHRLLGWRPDNATRFRHDRGNRLKYDVVVVDECSMVELTMMGRLLEAVRPQARLVLVGDPRQLTSVGAGAVLADVVRGFEGHPGSPVVSLTENYRSTEDIKDLAEALRVGDADEVLATLRRASEEVEFVETDEPAEALRADALDAALEIRAAAEAGDHERALAALDRHRLLCAHREGPYGVRHWNRTVERWVAEETGQPIYTAWYVGRPVLVTTNDYALGVYNGETGVAVAQPDGRLRVWVAGSESVRDLAPGRLEAIETMHAMTIHKSQGSQAERVTVLLPEAGSRLLTRELFYTAVTRAQRQVRVVGTEAAVRAAVETQAQRATGLRQRLLAARSAD